MAHDWDMMRSMAPISTKMLEKGGSSKAVKPMTEETRFRGSSTGDFCARKLAIESVLGIESVKTYGRDSQFYFTIGNGIHAAFQDDIFSKYLIGSWRCGGCGKVHGSIDRAIKMPSRCDGMVWNTETEELEQCPNHNWIEDVILDWHLPGFRYEELSIRSDDPPFYAHPDGILWRGEDAPPDELDLTDASSLDPDVLKYLEILELKSAGEDAINNGYSGEPPLKLEPSEKHKRQVSTYMYFTKIPRSRIVYIDKAGSGWRSAVIEHVVLLNIDYIEREVINPVRSLYEAIRRGDHTIATRVCDDALCSKAVSCPVSKHCFPEAHE
jgi:hypothetical protein